MPLQTAAVLAALEPAQGAPPADLDIFAAALHLRARGNGNWRLVQCFADGTTVWSSTNSRGAEVTETLGPKRDIIDRARAVREFNLIELRRSIDFRATVIERIKAALNKPLKRRPHESETTYTRRADSRLAQLKATLETETQLRTMESASLERLEKAPLFPAALRGSSLVSVCTTSFGAFVAIGPDEVEAHGVTLPEVLRALADRLEERERTR